MNRSRKTFVACVSGLAVLASLACAGGDARSDAVPSGSAAPVSTAVPVTVVDAWARPADQGANTAVYLTLENAAAPDTVTAVTTDASESASVHETTQRDGMMHMQAVAAVAVPAGDRLVFAPLGRHIMLMRLRRPLAAGDSVSLMLSLASGARVPVTAVVRAP